MITDLSDDQIKAKLDLIESLILYEQDWKRLPALNRCMQILIDEQVRRECNSVTT